MDDRNRTVRVPVMARVEGKGALEITLADGVISSMQLRIFEPPRLFEKILEGRDYREVPDIVARICGICPAAYQITATKAIESAFGADADGTIRRFRRILACGEWIESHSLHIHLLAAPDFLGYRDVMEWAKHDPAAVRRGFQIHAAGNALIQLLGGRSVHPVGVCVGGFYRFPTTEACSRVAQHIRDTLPAASDLVKWASTIDYPDADDDFVFVSLRDPERYPMNEGRIVSSRGLDIPPSDFEANIEEYQVPHSTAFHSRLDGKPYLVGPLSRLNLNIDRMPASILSDILSTRIRFPSRNMNHSLLARALEIHYALQEALELLEPGTDGSVSRVACAIRRGSGIAATEAPRGILWHRYEIAGDGTVERARIIPPTSQNQSVMETDLKRSLERGGLDRPDDDLKRDAERIVRNYDPCISCATHFLDLSVRRNGG